MAKRKTKKKDKDNPVISETPVIDGQQANAPPEVVEPDVVKKAEAPAGSPSEKVVMEIGKKAPPPEKVPVGTVYKPQRSNMPRSWADVKTTKRPVVEKEPEPVPPEVPVICAGCKRTVELSTTRKCAYCKGGLRYCEVCAKPGSCHKCGKTLT